MIEETIEARRLRLVEEWRAAIAPKKEWEAYEKAKRSEVVAEFFATPILGTNRIALPNGEKLKLVYKLTYSLGDKDLVDPILQEKVPIDLQVKGTLDAISSLGGEGPLLAERLIKWKPELNEPEYKKLRAEVPIEAEAKKLIDSILTASPASPQLTLEPLK